MNRKFKISVVAVVLLLLAPYVFAAAEGLLDFIPIPGLKAAETILKRVMENLLTVATWGVVLGIITSIIPVIFPEGILWNPTIVGPNANSAIVGIIKTVLVILQPILVLWIVIIGLYLLFMTGSPGGRIRAKIMFWKAIFAMILLSLSMPLFQILMDMSKALASAILEFGGVDFITGGILAFGNFLTPITGFFTSAILIPGSALETDEGVKKAGSLLQTVTIIFTLLLVLAVPFVIMLRYFVLTFLAVLFPFALLFNFIDVPFIPFKGIGEKLIRLTFMWTFSQVVMALTLVGVSAAISNSPSLLLSVILSALGIFMVAAAPLMMTGLMKWIGAIMATIGMTLGPGVGSMMIAVGMLLMGAGPLAAMSTAGVHMMIWGFRPGATESPLYRTGAAQWQGWGIPPTATTARATPTTTVPSGELPEGVVGQKMEIGSVVPKEVKEPAKIEIAEECIRRGNENLELSKPLTGKEKAGYLETARKNFDRAVDELMRISAKDVAPEQLAGTYFRLGQGYEKVGNLSRAIECYQIANGINPNAKYLTALGEIYAKRG